NWFGAWVKLLGAGASTPFLSCDWASNRLSAGGAGASHPSEPVNLRRKALVPVTLRRKASASSYWQKGERYEAASLCWNLRAASLDLLALASEDNRRANRFLTL